MANIQVLGTLRVMNGDDDCTPTPPKMRSVLALLALNANRVVGVGALIEELWGAEPPRSAVTTVQTYIYHLRQLFYSARLDEPGRQLLVTRQPGYLLQIGSRQVDAEVFESLVRKGRTHLELDEPRQAALVLEEALGMWTGPALADVPLGSALTAHAVRLEERRISALELRIEADIRLGRYHDLAGELRQLVHTHPLNEWFHGQLIRVLGGTGRRGEALQAYQALRAVLRDELGIDPSPALQRLQQQLLTAGPEDMLHPMATADY